jgi:hypothetical protein
MLYWNVKSEVDGEATIQITYFTSGITWSADYIAIADKDENKLNIDGFVRVTNNSGEEYENAQVRLVVGTINLVEKIAELARVPMKDVKDLKKAEFDRLRDEVATRAMSHEAFGIRMPVSTATPSSFVTSTAPSLYNPAFARLFATVFWRELVHRDLLAAEGGLLLQADGDGAGGKCGLRAMLHRCRQLFPMPEPGLAAIRGLHSPLPMHDDRAKSQIQNLRHRVPNGRAWQCRWALRWMLTRAASSCSPHCS